jgi:hypothetical protein
MTRNKPARRNNHAQLGDRFGEYFLKWLYGSDFDQAVTIVHDRCIEKYGGWWCSILFARYSCMPYDTTDSILKCYTNLASQGKIPEYDPHTTMEVRQAIINPIQKCSGFSWELIHQALFELYTATKVDGAISNGAILYPHTTLQYAKERDAANLPDSVPSSEKDADKAGHALDDFLTYLKWGVIIGGSAVVMYYLWQFYETANLGKKLIE